MVLGLLASEQRFRRFIKIALDPTYLTELGSQREQKLLFSLEKGRGPL